MRFVFYMAHPLGGDVEGNLKRAMRWLRWLRRSFQETTFVAPWIASVLSGEDDADPAQREAGLVDADAIIPRLTGVVLVGGRISSGMLREAHKAEEVHAGGRVFDLTKLGIEPPEVVERATFLDFIRSQPTDQIEIDPARDLDFPA
jgi:hypothetical protein